MVKTKNAMAARAEWAKQREGAGYTSDQALLRALGVSADRTYNWFQKGEEPRMPTLRKLAAHLHMTLVELDDLMSRVRTQYRLEREKGGRADDADADAMPQL